MNCPRCVFCVYGMKGSRRLTVEELAEIPLALHIVDTPNGPREVCRAHLLMASEGVYPKGVRHG